MVAIRLLSWLVQCPDGRILGIDADPAAIRRVEQLLPDEVSSGRLVLFQATFDRLEQVAAEVGFAPVDGILLDLGVSSFQLETPERGFSLMMGGPLDMRFDPQEDYQRRRHCQLVG